MKLQRYSTVCQAVLCGIEQLAEHTSSRFIMSPAHCSQCWCIVQAGERQADVLSRQVSKSSTESQDLAREREVLLDKLRAAEQVVLQLPLQHVQFVMSHCYLSCNCDGIVSKVTACATLQMVVSVVNMQHGRSIIHKLVTRKDSDTLDCGQLAPLQGTDLDSICCHFAQPLCWAA